MAFIVQARPLREGAQHSHSAASARPAPRFPHGSPAGPGQSLGSSAPQQTSLAVPGPSCPSLAGRCARGGGCDPPSGAPRSLFPEPPPPHGVSQIEIVRTAPDSVRKAGELRWPELLSGRLCGAERWPWRPAPSAGQVAGWAESTVPPGRPRPCSRAAGRCGGCFAAPPRVPLPWSGAGPAPQAGRPQPLCSASPHHHEPTGGAAVLVLPGAPTPPGRTWSGTSGDLFPRLAFRVRRTRARCGRTPQLAAWLPGPEPPDPGHPGHGPLRAHWAHELR